MNVLELTLPYTRTPAGESELHEASHGLSLVQRKLLSAFNGETATNRLDMEHRLEAEVVERSISRLLDLGLIAAETDAQSVIGPAKSWARDRSLPIVPLAIGALLIVAALAYWGMKSNRSAPETTAAVAVKPRPESTRVVADNPAMAAPPANDPAADSNPLIRLWQQGKAAEDALAAKALPPQKRADTGNEGKPPASPPVIAMARPEPAVQAPLPQAPLPRAVIAPAAPLATPKPAEAAPAAPPVLAPAPAPALAEAAPAAKAAAPRILSKEAPTFPREAIAQGIISGIVKVQLTVDGTGTVTDVAILQAEPRRVFDRAVIRALRQWKFEANGSTQTMETEVVFDGKS